MKKAIISILCVCLLLSFCACGEKRPEGADKEFFYALSSEPQTLDPQVASDAASLTVITALFEGLVRLDENGNPYPGVATSWSANRDSTVFTFSLREDACWSDISSDDPAEPVTAEDFVFAFRRAVNPDTKSPNASQFFCIKNAQQIYSGAMPVDALGVSASDTHTLTVELEYSLPDFPTLTASAAFMPCKERFFNETNGRYGLERKYVLGNGPFAFSGYYAWEHNDHLSLTRSAVYHGETEVLPASLYFYVGEDAVDLSDPINALSSGTVQLLTIPAAAAAQAESAGMALTRMNTSTYGLCLNTADDLMKHPEIRKAFLQTLDRETLLSKIPDGMTAADDIISPEMTLSGSNYREAAGSGFLLPEDLEAAASANTVLQSLDYETMPSVSVLCEDRPEITALVNELIVSWNRTMGNYFNMTPVSADELENRVFFGEYQIAFYALAPNGSTPISLLEQFSSAYSGNPAHLKDSAYDALVRSFYTESNLLSACKSAETYLNTEGIFYPVCYDNAVYAAAPGVQGISIHPYGTGIDFIHAVIK